VEDQEESGLKLSINGPAAATGSAEFERFVRDAEPRLRRLLVAAYGFEDGRDAVAEALGYAWEHWPRVRTIPHPVGYLFRLGQSRSSRLLPRRQRFDVSGWVEPSGAEPRFEPGLPGALAALSQRQRVAVVLVHGFGYSLREVAELTGVKVTTVQNHLERGLTRLRAELGVHDGQ
jgi:DNA-directed RNA polymerase specialized sigma24 family protein